MGTCATGDTARSLLACVRVTTRARVKARCLLKRKHLSLADPTTALQRARRGDHHGVGLRNERGCVNLRAERRKPRPRQSAHHEPSYVIRDGGQHRASVEAGAIRLTPSAFVVAARIPTTAAALTREPCHRGDRECVAAALWTGRRENAAARRRRRRGAAMRGCRWVGGERGRVQP